MSLTRAQPSRLEELAEILWAHMQDLDAVRRLKRRPSLEKRLRVVHALAQLSGAYLKVEEAKTMQAHEARLQALEALFQGRPEVRPNGRH